MVMLKLLVVLLIILVGGYLVFSTGSTHNWLPPDDKGVNSFMPNGFSGVMAAVSGVFFAYIGFDAVSVLAEESKNPQRDLPKGMILSLVICTIVYILLTLVLTGAVNYRKFDGVGDPLAFIFEKDNLNVGWMQFFVSIAAVVAMTSVLLVFQMGQPRIWMSMSRDGLMPPVFQKIHPKYKTPSFATIITGIVVGLPILFTDKTFVLDFTSIATLFAFVLVCGGVLLIPRREKEAGKFHIPFINGKLIFPVIVIASIALASFLSKNYFAEKFDFSFERKVDALNKLMVIQQKDTTATSLNIERYLVNKNDADSAFIKLTSFIQATSFAPEKFNIARKFIKDNDTTQSRTAKISAIIFWLLMIGLAFFTFFKDYSLIPLLGVSTCLYLLTGMSLSNWVWFGGWLAIGLIFYFLYGYKKSRLAAE
jgi:amino acid transporter